MFGSARVQRPFSSIDILFLISGLVSLASCIVARWLWLHSAAVDGSPSVILGVSVLASFLPFVQLVAFGSYCFHSRLTPFRVLVLLVSLATFIPWYLFLHTKIM